MRYSARAVTQAAAGPVLRIGPADATLAADRRWSGRLRAWWVTRVRTWTAAPLSVPQMLRLQAAARDPLAYLLTLAGLLRTVLPFRWRYVVLGDPVRMVLRLPPDAMGHVLKGFVAPPMTDRDVSREADDPIELIRAAQRRSVYGDADPRTQGVSLAVAALSVRAEFGDAWYYAPDRWPTTDGYVPFALALVEYAGVQSLEVRRRLEVADGMSLAHAKDPRRARQQLEQMAYPVEVC